MLYFDFEKIYQDRFVKRSKESEFFKELENMDITFSTYLKEVFSKYKNFYVSCPNIERKVVKELKKDVYKNYFFRPITDNKKEIMLQTDLVFSDDKIVVEVKDIYVNKNVEKQKYETKINVSVSTFIENKKAKSDSDEMRNIISNTPFICDQKGKEFVLKWLNYLEFEKNFFYDKIGYCYTDSYEVIEIVEIKRSIEKYQYYKDVLYYDDGNNYLYVRKEDCQESLDSFFIVEFDLEVRDTSKIGWIASFIKEEIEIANKKEALDENKKLKNNTVSDIEFSFRTKRLGALLKPLTKKEDNIYSFSKFWTGEEILKERINDYIYTFFGENPLLVNILSGDLALYKRGKQALKDLLEGNVKNPGIISYLTNPESITLKENIDRKDINWSSPYLDSYQKEAIFKALNSESLFLIQGPPGTGKTQVISELVYQLNKLGKKVLLSSQTHVAIDNALDRLPNELDILPIRLINLERKTKSTKDFLPDKLVDNLYFKIKNQYANKQEDFVKYFDKLKQNKEELDRIKFLLENNDRRHYLKTKYEIEQIKKNILINDNELINAVLIIKESKETLSFIEVFSKNDYKIYDYGKYISLSSFPLFNEIINKYKLNDFYNVENNDLNQYFKICLSEKLLEKEKFIKDYNNILDNQNFENFKLELTNEVENNLQKQKELLNKKKELNIVLLEKEKLLEKELKQKGKIYQEIDEYFISNLDIDDINNPLTDEEKIKFLEEKLENKEKELKQKEQHYLKYKDIYLDCIDFLNHKATNLEEDKQYLTRYLLNNNANVVGITCNANSSYLEERNEYLKTLGLGNVNLKNMDFDVTIIDEVSKATPIELLIPILYSKSIILVGDHRQLPPTFKYKENMLEALSEENKISEVKLREYQNMVEDSLFSELFAKVKENKAMLINQYRSHRQIVDVTNTFYDDKLQIANEEKQNQAKEHNIEISLNGSYLFTKDVHTYWFNSYYNQDGSISYEKKLLKGEDFSTSFINEQEIYLTENILKEFDEFFTKHRDVEVPSIGVISLYGDQVKEIRKKVLKNKYQKINIDINKISTVDEFQGKEEDIIIVSLVRNNPKFNAGEFTKKFERINVATSRAKKMLIVLGATPFFTKLEVPISSTESNEKVNRKLYKEVYERFVAKIEDPNQYFN